MPDGPGFKTRKELVGVGFSLGVLLLGHFADQGVGGQQQGGHGRGVGVSRRRAASSTEMAVTLAPVSRKNGLRSPLR
jgi:hypothetical protein